MTALATTHSPIRMGARLLLRCRGGDWQVHWFWCGGPGWCRDLVSLVIAIPDSFAGSLPEPCADPGEDQQLAYQKCGDDRLRIQAVHPDVQTEGEEQPLDDADTEINPEQRENIAAEECEGAAECAMHFLFVVGYGEMVAGVGGYGLVLDVGVHRVGSGREARDREQHDDEIDQQAEKAPEV